MHLMLNSTHMCHLNMVSLQVSQVSMFIMHYANTFGRRVPKKKHLKLQARRQRVKKVMKMLRGVPKTHVLGQPYSVLFSRFMMDFNENVQKPWVFEAIDFNGANAMSIKTRPLTRAVTKNMSTPKLVKFHHLLDSRSLRKTCQHQNSIFTISGIPGVWEKHVNTKTSQFSPFVGFQEFEKKRVNTKTRQFWQFLHFFLDSRSWERNMSTPKLVNFPHILDSRSLRKTCQHQN